MDPRARAAQYYDANPAFPNDVPFYRQRIPSPQAKVLELGCGTGRVLVSLLGRCGYEGETYGEGPELVAQLTVADRKAIYRD